jgi:hypothetical protein
VVVKESLSRMASGKIGGGLSEPPGGVGGERHGFLQFVTFVFVAEYQEREKVVISS